MIKLQDIRIGNYFSYYNGEFEGEIYYIDAGVFSGTGDVAISISGGGYTKTSIDDLKPILLTEEWLVRFGFKCVHKKNKHYNIVHPKGYKDNYTINLVPTLNEQWQLAFHDLTVNQSYITCTHIKHVHQLQNLYFALTEEELKLKL